MLAELFPRVRAGLSYAYNWAMRRPYGKPMQFAEKGSFNEGEIRQWGVPELNSTDARVRQRLHEKTMANLVHDQPVNRLNWLTKRVLKEGLDLGEKGSTWLADELSKDQEARNALKDAYTSPGMTALVVKYSNPGLLKKRAYTNSVLAIAGTPSKKPITAGNIFYSDLRNHSLYRGGRLEELFKQAREKDAEQPQQAVVFQPQVMPRAEGLPGGNPMFPGGEMEGAEPMVSGNIPITHLLAILRAVQHEPVKVSFDNHKIKMRGSSQIGGARAGSRSLLFNGQGGEVSPEAAMIYARMLQAQRKRSSGSPIDEFFKHHSITNEKQKEELLNAARLLNHGEFKEYLKKNRLLFNLKEKLKSKEFHEAVNAD